MVLPARQVDRFYSIWKPLLFFANKQRRLSPSLLGADMRTPLPVKDVSKIRDAIWEDVSLLRAFIDQNPASLPPEDLDLARDWFNFRKGTFFIFKHLKNHSVFINDRQEPKVYAVKGLYNTFEEVLPAPLPILVQAVLLPYENEITYDGIVAPYNVSFGSGIRGNLRSIYADAKELGDIITSLKPVEADSPERQATKAATTNAKVLAAFARHLYRSGLSPKIVERDTANITAFAQNYLRCLPKPHSLREATQVEVNHYLSNLVSSDLRQNTTSLKRFCKFLYETGRIDPLEAEDILSMLRKT
jgi:hypothetical protein